MFQDYDKFWENFGKNMKLGCLEDHSNHKRLAPLLRFFSSHGEQELISLDEYVENMKPEQKAIYYIAAESITSAKNAPFLEKILEKDMEVCSFTVLLHSQVNYIKIIKSSIFSSSVRLLTIYAGFVLD